MSNPKGRVLVVDDEPRNIRTMEGILAPQGYELRRTADGAQALRDAVADPPDVILLDVMMPGLSGFDVCRELKAHPETRRVPIALVTSLADRDSRVAGLEAGADDFLSKPVDPSELRARVAPLLRSKRLHDELQRRYEDLHRLEEMRQGLTQMIVHDLRNPLTAMAGFLDLLDRGGHVSKERTAQDALKVVQRGAQTLIDMTTAMLDAAKLEAGEMRLEVVDVGVEEVVAEVGAGMRSLLERRSLALATAIPPDLPQVRADRESLRRILVNIVSNAIAFSPPRASIMVSAHGEDPFVRISVADEGLGISPDDQGRIFDKVGALDSRGTGRKLSTGLRLAFCKMAVEAHGGRIGVESAPGRGSTFWFTLPARPRAAALAGAPAGEAVA